MSINARARYDKDRKRERRRGYETYDDAKVARDAFREEAKAQRCCQHPDCEKPTAAWQAHHIVYEQDLRKLGKPVFDPRNAMRLCEPCHTRHHRRISVVPQSVLTPANIEYAREVLGDAYIDYLNRHYTPECQI